MFVVFKNGEPIKSFKTQKKAVDYWNKNGGTIILYPDLTAETVAIMPED